MTPSQHRSLSGARLIEFLVAAVVPFVSYIGQIFSGYEVRDRKRVQTDTSDAVPLVSV